MENNKELEWLFGVTDKDMNEVIEQQANTESDAPNENKTKAAVHTKKLGKDFNKRPRESRR